MLRACVVVTVLAFMSSLWAADFEAKIFKKGEDALPYGWMTPKNMDQSQLYPLVIFLHGAGERGDDNKAQLRYAMKFAHSQDQFPCYVFVPQCPANHRWVEVDWGDREPHKTPEQPSLSMGLLLELLPTLIKDNRVDASRIYVVGMSMGGFGTWDLLVRRPDLIAAAVPICGGADNSQAKRIAHIPVWVWHGDKDTGVPTVRAQSIVAALKEAGGNPIYTELPGVGHFSWLDAFKSDELFPWLFAQKKK
jgi:predicted peptidase